MNDEGGAIFIPNTDGVVPHSNGCCAYNKAVICFEFGDRCKKCGWNPKVEEKRRTKIREGLRNGACGD